jgi:hypothetical protein
MRAAVQCLGLVLRAVTADTWEYVSAVFAQMLQLLADPHPKVRERCAARCGAMCAAQRALAAPVDAGEVAHADDILVAGTARQALVQLARQKQPPHAL